MEQGIMDMEFQLEDFVMAYHRLEAWEGIQLDIILQ
jgi:hypothetical protein